MIGGIVMTKVVFNQDKNCIEIYFDYMPGGEVRNQLKGYGWRWFPKKKCWYNYDSNARRIQANRIGGNAKTTSHRTRHNRKGFDPLSWNEESLLRQNGYTVSKQEDLPPYERQRILDFVVEYHIMTVDKVIMYLTAMISLHEKNYDRYEYAIDKWNDDLNYIRNTYRIAG